MNSSFPERFPELPPIKRARECRLYDIHGRRYLDMHLLGGRALLGHRPAGVFKEMKNILSRGVLGEYPSYYLGRLKKAMSRLIPKTEEVRVFSSLERALEAVGAYLQGSLSPSDRPALMPREPVPHTGFGSSKEMPWETAYWRPFLPEERENELMKGKALFPIIPFPLIGGPSVVCFLSPNEETPPSDTVSPVLLGGLIRSVYSLLSWDFSYDEPYWARFETPLWTRVGPYLIIQEKEDSYLKLYRHFLEAGVLLPPRPPGPAVIPAYASEGEIALIRTLGEKHGSR